MNLEIHRSTKEENVFLDLIGDLDMAGAPILRQAIAQEVSQGNIFIVLNFSAVHFICLLYTSPSPRDKRQSRMPSSA